MDEGPFQIYLRLRRDGTLRPDKAQERAVARLQALYEDLKCEKNLSRPQNPILSRLGLCQKWPVPRGIYLFGGVGRGKTMLMDYILSGCFCWAKAASSLSRIYARGASLDSSMA